MLKSILNDQFVNVRVKLILLKNFFLSLDFTVVSFFYCLMLFIVKKTLCVYIYVLNGQSNLSNLAFMRKRTYCGHTKIVFHLYSCSFYHLQMLYLQYKIYNEAWKIECSVFKIHFTLNDENRKELHTNAVKNVLRGQKIFLMFLYVSYVHIIYK